MRNPFRGLVSKLNNGAVIGFMNLLRRLQIVSGRLVRDNHCDNLEMYRRHEEILSESDGLIEDQNAYEDMKFGKVTVRYAGCEIIAAFNACFSMLGRYIMPLPDMISEFEKDGMMLGGRFGVSPKSIARFLGRHGFTVRTSHREEEFDELGRNSQALILTMYNDRTDIMKQVHTICISKAGGKYTAHNVYCNGTVVGPCASVNELIASVNNGMAKGIYLIGIN